MIDILQLYDFFKTINMYKIYGIKSNGNTIRIDDSN